jgi:pimeloyl-ACP methyl ester carboxylesterase
MTYLQTPTGVKLRVTDRGRGAPPLVLVHGWKGSHRLWDPVIARLESDHRLVALDLRGMGESDKPRAAYDFDELAGDLRFVIDALAVRDAVLVGWSMGVTVSLSYLDSGGASVSGVVLVNGPLRLTRTPDFPHAMSDEQFEGYLTRLRDEWPAGEREFQAQTLLEPVPALVDWLYGIALQTPLDVALRVVREQAKLDMRGALAGLEVPVLAAYSRHDPYYPVSLADEIAALARDGRRVIFEHSAHCAPIEEADRFSQVVHEFATEVSQTNRR